MLQIKSLLQKAGLELGDGTGVTLAGSVIYMSARSDDHEKMEKLVKRFKGGVGSE